MNNYLKTEYKLNDEEIVLVIDELPLWSAPFGLKLLDKIKYRKNIVALDIGSGTGFPLLETAMRLGNSCKVYGIDPWKAAVARIKTKMKIYNITNVEVFSCVAENIPLPDKSVDLIFSNNGLNNVDNLEKVLSECSRISKNGAQLIFAYNTDKTMSGFYSVLTDLLHEKNMNNEIVLTKEHIRKKRRPLEEYIELLNENGFIINQISSDGFDYRFTNGTAMFSHFLIKLAFIGSWKELIPEEKQSEIFNELEERLNKIAASAGILKFSIPFVIIDSERVRQ